ncbi:MAG TPA: NAD(P)(+) transhydrogenase (Re/Si-specific) subunit beta [Myxococcota bacterium]|nr:NAD(P)(+) transhydrogenase (Re/Si-specific) subunit beta [Myxococcota bacterium]HQK50772.1 NAD(P)(+) transhydrogenase (Re/Si-specific) subunit beta [Myxococcota bacterium]
MKSMVVVLNLVAASLFIIGLKMQQRVPTARKGNLLSAVGMLLAVVVTLVGLEKLHWSFILAGLVTGSVIGLVFAYRVKMTAMPQMIAIFNGLGGGASAVVALSLVYHDVLDKGLTAIGPAMGMDAAVTVALSILIGGVTLTGSLVAFAKLQELVSGNPTLLPGRHLILVLVGLGSLAVGGYMAGFANGPEEIQAALWVLTGLSLVLGVLLVIPIGGADMPVVISLLNSYSGLAAAMTGFVIHNEMLIITGSLVGAAGIILTQIMCKAMNRSLANVMFGGFGATTTSSGGGSDYQNVKSAGLDEAAMILEGAQSVIFVPGYGLAVAQAQHALRDLAEALQRRGVQVRYAIHPVAGRMPGHMNVLLAEANVPYEQLVEMDQINPEFRNTDVVVVLGANDVVNPAANRDPKSPIYGMPILNVHEARTVLVVKRSLGSGFAGIKNELFEAPNALMVFSDAKAALTGILEELKNA